LSLVFPHGKITNLCRFDLVRAVVAPLSFFLQNLNADGKKIVEVPESWSKGPKICGLFMALFKKAIFSRFEPFCFFGGKSYLKSNQIKPTTPRQTDGRRKEPCFARLPFQAPAPFAGLILFFLGG